jgi:acetyltransferase-like isoleucine patch superfamily enzyme
MSGAFVETSVHIGEGSLLNVRAMISHDCRIGAFCEFGPSVVVLGTSTIGNRTLIGASAVVLKNIQIGQNVIVGAGAVVNRDVPDNTVVAGVPAREIKKR